MSEHGTIYYDGMELTLTQQPYADNSWVYHTVGYFANAVDVNGNEYEIFWRITNEFAEDESDACDWTKFMVRKLC